MQTTKWSLKIMAKIEKFKFDNDLIETQISENFSDSLVISDAFEKGRLQGRTDAEMEFEAERQNLLSEISKSLQNSILLMNSELVRIENEAIKMTCELAKLYSNAVTSKDPSGAISAIIKKATQSIGNAPILTINVGPILTDEMRNIINSVVIDAGYSGSISIIENSNLNFGDIEIEWPQGGFRYSRDNLQNIIDNYISDTDNKSESYNNG